MPDEIFKLPIAQPDLEDKAALERRDEAGPKFNEREQERIARETGGVFDKNRVPSPGIGQGGRVVRNHDHWAE